MASPKLEPVVLSDDERQVLDGWARRRKTAQALALRSRIVLACADGSAVSAVAAELGISRTTAGKWRSRFLESRLEGLNDEPRPGRPRTVTDEHVEKVIVATLEQVPPNGDTHWSTRSMARSEGMSQSAVSRIWRAFGLKPHIIQTWKLSTDPQFIDKVRDVVGLYMAPPENALVLCVDEKSQIQALDRTAPCLPSSSWINLVERWFAELTNRKLRRSAHRSVTELEAGIRKWINEWNKDPKPFVWTKTADEILETLAAYCERINDSGH
jgi:transposase